MARSAAVVSLPGMAAPACVLIGLLAVPPTLAAQTAPASADYPVGERSRVEMMGTLWSPARDLRVASRASGVSGATRAGGRDPGGASPRFLDLRMRVRPGGRHRIHLDYVPVRYAAVTTLDGRLVLGGVDFEPGTPIASTLTWRTWRAAWGYDLIRLARGSLGLLAEARYTDMRIALNRAAGAPCEPAPTACELTRARRLAPAVGAALRLYPSPVIGLGAEASLVGMPPGIGGLLDPGGDHLVYDVHATLNFLEGFGLQIGYRSQRLNVETAGHAADLLLEGVYAGALLRF